MNAYIQLSHGGLYGMKRFRKMQKRSSFYKSSKIMDILKKDRFLKEHNFSSWEKRILRKLRSSGLSIETKFRNFSLYIENEEYEYFPDFFMEDFEYKNREILVEAHEKISEADVKKFRKFLADFGSSYYLIMVVSDGELRTWNEYNKGKQKFFNEIWTSNDVDLLIEYLKKLKKKYEKKISQFQQNALCPKCGKKAKGYKKIVELFGYRGKNVQSFCRKCRSK